MRVSNAAARRPSPEGIASNQSRNTGPAVIGLREPRPAGHADGAHPGALRRHAVHMGRTADHQQVGVLEQGDVASASGDRHQHDLDAPPLPTPSATASATSRVFPNKDSKTITAFTTSSFGCKGP